MNKLIVAESLYEDLVSTLNDVKDLLSINENNQKSFLDNDEFLNLMKISRRTAQNWRDQGKIAFSQITGKIYYQMVDIEALLSENYNPSFKKR